MPNNHNTINSPVIFKHLLTDYFSTGGIDISPRLKAVIVGKLFQPGKRFYQIRALQYGRCVLLFSHCAGDSVNAVYFMNFGAGSLCRWISENGSGNLKAGRKSGGDDRQRRPN